MTETKTKEVAEKKDNLPAGMLAGMQEQGGAGFEDTTSDDYAIPYLSIAQALSKAMKKGSEQHIDGLELGDIYDPVSGEKSDVVSIVPLVRQRFHVEWDDRQFVARHPISDGIIETCTRNDKGHDILPNGNKITDTVYLYALVLAANDGVNSPVVISFSRSSMKIYKKLMARANKLRLGEKPNRFQAPLHSHIYSLTTAGETSKQGEDFYNWRVEGDPQLITDEQLWAEASALRDQIASGERTAADPRDEADDSTPSGF